PNEKNTAATERGGSAERARRRLATRSTRKKSATTPSAERTYEFGWSVGLPKKKPIACTTLSGTYESENGFERPGLLWSCHADARMSKIRLWRAQWTMRSGATTTSQGMTALPSRRHTHRIIAATGSRKTADS